MCESGRNEMQASLELKLKSYRGAVLVGGDVAVGEHHALGLAGGSRGVDERGQVAGLDRARQRVEDRIALAAPLVGSGQQLAEGDGAVGRCGRIHDDDALELRLRADRVELVELLARGNDGDAAAGVADQQRAICSPVSVG